MQMQATAAQDSVKAVQRQMRQDQRAWIVFTPAPPVVEDNGPFLQSFKFVNTGKTPAKRIWIDADIEVVKNADSPRLRYGHGHIHAITTTGIFYPNSDPMIFTIDRRQVNPETGKNEPSLLKHAEWLRLHPKVFRFGASAVKPRQGSSFGWRARLSVVFDAPCVQPLRDGARFR